jgi:hypothetical protein
MHFRKKIFKYLKMYLPQGPLYKFVPTGHQKCKHCTFKIIITKNTERYQIHDIEEYVLI